MDKEFSTKTMLKNSQSKQSSEKKNSKQYKQSTTLIEPELEGLALVEHESSVSDDADSKEHSVLPENQLIDPSELGELWSEYQDDFNIDTDKWKSFDIPFKLVKEHSVRIPELHKYSIVELDWEMKTDSENES